MFKLFAKKETTKIYKVTVMNLDTKNIETVEIDSKGFTGLIIAGFEILNAELVETLC